MPVQDGDTEADAQKVAKNFAARDTKQYYDKTNTTSVSLGKTLRLPPSEWGGGDDLAGGAWDVFALFAAGAVWHDRPPTPTFWTHQLENVKTQPSLDAKELTRQVEML